MRHVVQQLAAFGRNGDTMLMHVAPEEVQGLRALAKHMGTSVTINPRTGLPEAFNFKSLIPTLAGIAVSPFAGPMAGMAVGAALGGALAPSDNRLAGILSGAAGGYGGAGLGGAISSLGTAAAAPAIDVAAAQGTAAATAAPELGAGVIPSGLGMDAAAPAVSQIPQEVFRASEIAAQNAAGQVPGGLGSLQRGAQALWNDPSQAGSLMTMNNAKSIALPIAGSLMSYPENTSSDDNDTGSNYEAELWWDKRTPVYGMPNGIQRTRIKGYAQGGLPQFGGQWVGGQGPDAPPSALQALLSNPNFRVPAPLPAPVKSSAPPMSDVNAYLSQYAAMSKAMPIVDRVPQPPATPPVAPPTAPVYQAGGYWGWPSTGGPGGSVGSDGTSTGDGGIGVGTNAEGDAAGVGVGPMAAGGLASVGKYLRGGGDGMSDSIPAHVEGSPIRVANNEYVVPADVVSHLGNGSSEAGARVLDAMGSRVRKARTGNPKQGKQINPSKFVPG